MGLCGGADSLVWAAEFLDGATEDFDSAIEGLDAATEGLDAAAEGLDAAGEGLDWVADGFVGAAEVVGGDLVAPDVLAFFSFPVSQILSMVFGGRMVLLFLSLIFRLASSSCSFSLIFLFLVQKLFYLFPTFLQHHAVLWPFQSEFSYNCQSSYWKLLPRSSGSTKFYHWCKVPLFSNSSFTCHIQTLTPLILCPTYNLKVRVKHFLWHSIFAWISWLFCLNWKPAFTFRIWVENSCYSLGRTSYFFQPPSSTSPTLFQ